MLWQVLNKPVKMHKKKIVEHLLLWLKNLQSPNRPIAKVVCFLTEHCQIHLVEKNVIFLLIAHLCLGKQKKAPVFRELFQLN